MEAVLFISYHHADNAPFGRENRQWVTVFHDGLRKRLEQLVPKGVRIWRDDKLRCNDVLDDSIFQELRESTLFLCVLSRGYLDSDWCKREVEMFLEETSKDGSSGKGRLFKIVKTPVVPEREPEKIRGIVGRQFYSTESSQIHLIEPDKSEFWEGLDDVAWAIASRIESSALPSVGAPDATLADAKTVYLAEGTSDVRDARDKIRRELFQRGFRVVPDQLLPQSSKELLPILGSELARAVLTVHPVGGNYGFIPEGDERSIVELQLDEATRNNGHAQHLIWIAPDMPPSEDRRQQEFLGRLRTVYIEQAGAELLEKQPLEELKTRLVEKLSPPKVSKPLVQGNRRVYLICAPGDLEAIKPVERCLRAEGCVVQLPLMSGDEEEIRLDHQDTWVYSAAVLIYYGAGTPAWLRTKQRDLWKAPGWGRKEPLLASAVYVAPPFSEEKSAVTSDEYMILREGAEFSARTLAPFLERLGGAP